ncbi:EAL domain-containing protein [Micromonospora sp. NPDC049559]|uniref:putative bifunctional diguanylate cyclase/phosphodiesterase n=1 Tax=Micromonospora sp. NPDC049559 TaxID=3155923 RepID=UPI00341C0E06
MAAASEARVPAPRAGEATDAADARGTTDARDAAATPRAGDAADAAPPGARSFAARWGEAVAQHVFVPMSAAEVERLLLVQTTRLAAAALAEPFATAPAYEVGRALVEAHLAEPAVLGWSVRALGDGFLDTVLPAAAASPAVRERVAALQGALAAGFAGALRDRTFSQQERIARSAWQARDLVERALRDSEDKFRTVFTGAAIGIAIADTAGRLVEVNESFARMLGYTVAELRHMPWSNLAHPDDERRIWELYQGLVAGDYPTLQVEKRYYRKDGSLVRTHLALSLIRHDDGSPRFGVAMVEDITERHELQQRLRFQALHDPLTGLANRTLLFERLNRIFAGAPPQHRVGVCFLDLDGFKGINDSLGHDLGDRLLVVIAQRLAECGAEGGHLVARMGGDEFVILVEGPSGADEVVEVAERALTAVATPVLIGDQQLVVSASIGIVEGPIDETSRLDLMKAADTTLYWAKAEGRGRWALYDPVRSARDRAKAALAARLPAALERGEFEVDYQPILALADGSLRAVEALVRWRHPELGLLGPDRFIGLSEETGLIVPLGRWVLERACADGERWRREFPEAGLVISVNLAARQANDAAIVRTVADVLRRTGLPAELLQLELTESALMGSAGEPLRTLHRLSALGVRLAVDDFGTGYSSLAYLRRLPIHSLKLAAPFVEGIRSGDPRGMVDERIVDALVRLAHALGLSVTAEAVETAEQAELLRALGCDDGQGMFFGAPAPAAEITALLGKERTD